MGDKNSLTAEYSKWDSFEEETEDMNSDFHSVKAQQFNLGSNQFEVKDVNHISDEVEASIGKRIRKLNQNDKDIWQVVIRKLRVWSASESGVACRPYCIFINQLYPQSALIYQEICSPPELYPIPSQIVNILTKAFLNPLSGDQRKPKTLTFTNPVLAGELHLAFRRQWGIDVSELSESEGIDTLIKSFSDVLIKKDIASISSVSERPGLLSIDFVTPVVVSSLFDSAIRFAALHPWRNIQEQQVFEVSVSKPKQIVSKKDTILVTPGKVWVSVLGFRGGTYGIAIFNSKLDLESRMGQHFGMDSTSRCSFSGRTPLELGHELKKTKPPRVDIRDGSELMYADNEALKKHWPEIRPYAITKDEYLKGLEEKRQYWQGTEFTMLFEEATYLPFDDLDMIDELNLPIVSSAEELGENTFPLFLQFNHGTPSRPSLAQLVWFSRCLEVVAAYCDNNQTGTLLLSNSILVYPVDDSLCSADEVSYCVITSPNGAHEVESDDIKCDADTSFVGAINNDDTNCGGDTNCNDTNRKDGGCFII